MPFNELGLSEKVLAAVDAAGYKEPTPIQTQSIPHVLERRDVIGIAQTGTGKTASFVLPMLSLLERGRARARMPRTLILEPTRELAAQVEENFVRYGTKHNLTVALLIGGVSFADQERKLDRGADVLIATPGRLLDHFERGKLLLTGVEILVIDEADRMLDMGFIPDIERICKLVPFTRQTLFFSATMPPEIQKLTGQFLQNPVSVEVAKRSSTADTVAQRLVSSPQNPKDKRAILRRELRDAGENANAIVFCNRKRDVATIHRSLQRHGFNVGALHGDLDQRERMATLAAFRAGTIAILVASDVAARGLDIPAVSHVVNFDVPTHPEDYVHRIGRTGRAGRSGAAVTITTPADTKYLARIEEMLGKPIPRAEIEEEPTDSAAAPEERKAQKPPRRRKGAKAKETEAAVEAAEADVESSEATARSPRRQDEKPRDEKPRGDKSRDEKPREAGRRRGRRDHDREPDEQVVGFGEHVPPFLLRPVRRPLT
ncbi:DEAD/DEAH box helicase [Lutibaculum baratangense]|uniref:DEAD-box ATP-dependent RNA helicase RhpA n=1 Tax=Lutibaculum baratangense AMV1 TaxID=631454 RepID=V4RID1_9HYPH|nr:DEAD/DEAH box helicase [Lutibaculum baratangense]ESR25099.1 ATP-dependent RNA helicase [Lutibaculum baratangense AMV1]